MELRTRDGARDLGWSYLHLTSGETEARVRVEHWAGPRVSSMCWNSLSRPHQTAPDSAPSQGSRTCGCCAVWLGPGAWSLGPMAHPRSGGEGSLAKDPAAAAPSPHPAFPAWEGCHH